MANLAANRQLIQTESVLTREPVSEFLNQAYGGNINYILPRLLPEQVFKINGNYRYYDTQLGVDGIWTAPVACVISNVIISHKTAGSGGITEIDIKTTTSPFIAWASIFSTTPKIDSSAPGFGWCGIGDVVGGFTAPILVGAPVEYAVAAGQAFRMDVISVMTGNPADVSIRLILNTR
jgi:hypothetical protein